MKWILVIVFPILASSESSLPSESLSYWHIFYLFYITQWVNLDLLIQTWAEKQLLEQGKLISGSTSKGNDILSSNTLEQPNVPLVVMDPRGPCVIFDEMLLGSVLWMSCADTTATMVWQRQWLYHVQRASLCCTSPYTLDHRFFPFPFLVSFEN